MTGFAAWDSVRAVNLTLAVMALAGMAWRRPFWRQQDPPIRLFLLVFTFGMLTAVYAEAEVLFTPYPEPGGPRVLVLTVALSLTNLALLRAHPARLRPSPRPDREEPR